MQGQTSTPWGHVAPGSKSSFAVDVVARAGGGHVALPVLIVRGRDAGPTLLVTSCIHGDEFEGPATIWQLVDKLDAATLKGTFVGVPLANPPAYEAGLRVNPDDRQDLARTFPGQPGGTVTEQIAHCLTTQFFAHVDFFVDLHSAGQYYTMPPLVGYALKEPLIEKQRQAARIMGVPLVWGTPWLPGRSLSAATELGVPSLYLEITGEGRCRPADVALYLGALERLLGHLGMAASPSPAAPPRWLVEDASPQAGFLQVQNRAAVSGFFVAETRVLDEVEGGQWLGTIRDPFGKAIQEIHAPHAGLVVFLRTFSRILAGEPVVTVLKLK